MDFLSKNTYAHFVYYIIHEELKNSNHKGNKIQKVLSWVIKTVE